jgi:transcription antitermination factor NusG
MSDVIYNSAADAHAPYHWYALQTRARHEKAIALRLQALSLEVFLPLHRSARTWKNGLHVQVDMPLFSCYLFVRSTIYDRLRILQAPGVLGFAASTAAPTAIPDSDMEMLKKATENCKAEPHPYLSAGDPVSVVAGPFAGLQGILTRRKQEYRVVLNVQAIMRSVVVEVSEFDIAPLQHVPSHAGCRIAGDFSC